MGCKSPALYALNTLVARLFRANLPKIAVKHVDRNWLAKGQLGVSAGDCAPPKNILLQIRYMVLHPKGRLTLAGMHFCGIVSPTQQSHCLVSCTGRIGTPKGLTPPIPPITSAYSKTGHDCYFWWYRRCRLFQYSNPVFFKTLCSNLASKRTYRLQPDLPSIVLPPAFVGLPAQSLRMVGRLSANFFKTLAPNAHNTTTAFAFCSWLFAIGFSPFAACFLPLRHRRSRSGSFQNHPQRFHH